MKGMVNMCHAVWETDFWKWKKKKEGKKGVNPWDREKEELQVPKVKLWQVKLWQ